MYEHAQNVLDSDPHALMMSPLSSERHSAGAVMAFDGQTEPNFSRRALTLILLNCCQSLNSNPSLDEGETEWRAPFLAFSLAPRWNVKEQCHCGRTKRCLSPLLLGASGEMKEKDGL